MYRRSIIVSTVWLSFCPPKQCTLHMERGTAAFVFGVFLGSVQTLFVKYTWTEHLPYVARNKRAIKVKRIRHFIRT